VARYLTLAGSWAYFGYPLTPVPGRKAVPMPKAAPWHSIKQPVHHNNTACTEGNNIERENYREGTGGKPLCQRCAELNKQGR
jgi:hypothetical protein